MTPMVRFFFICVTLTCGLLLGCGSGPTAGTTDIVEEAWMVPGDPTALGFSESSLEAARAFSEQIGSAAVVVVYKGHIVASWGPVTRKYFIRSIRKSFLSALYGIQVGAGTIDTSLTLTQLGINDAPVTLTSAERRARISDLLKSRSGVYIPSAWQSASARASLPERGSTERDAEFYYNNWDFNALGTIYRQLSGDIFEDFNKQIAEPLGMNFAMETDAGYFFERDVSMHPAYHFEISTTDLARFGLMYLRKGRWRDQQIVPASWVEASTMPYSQVTPETGYGMLWWTINDGSYAALGLGGLWIHVIPNEDLVIVHSVDTDAGDSVSADDYLRLHTMIRRARVDE